jgi:hypothetical protein
MHSGIEIGKAQETDSSREEKEETGEHEKYHDSQH